MALEQFNSTSDYLNRLNIQQLQGILRSELDNDEVDVELIKKINSVLASKSEEDVIDINAAFERLIDSSKNPELLYEEVLEEIEEEENKYKRHTPKVRYLIKGGIIAAVLVSLFIGTSIVAYAMGFNIWGVITTWTDNRFGFLVPGYENEALYSSNDIEDPYMELRNVLASLGDFTNVIPNYIPFGYKVIDVNYIESVDGPNIICVLTNGKQDIVLNYIVLHEEPSRIYTKDEGDPEIFLSNGFEHYIFTNDNHYRAVWFNGNIQCDFSGFTEESELLKIIDSLYGR